MLGQLCEIFQKISPKEQKSQKALNCFKNVEGRLYIVNSGSSAFLWLMEDEGGNSDRLRRALTVKYDSSSSNPVRG